MTADSPANPALFKIGDFSRLTRVPIKTLRYYDEVGLFAPAHVDTFTGYRYYSFDQLPRLNRLLALRGLGFSLEQIRLILDETLNADELRGMLRLRRAQLQQEVEESLEKLAQVEIRLSQIEQEGRMPEYEILTKQVEAITIVSAREFVADPSQMRERCMALNDAVCALIETLNLKTDGISFALYHNADDNGIDVEMAYVVEPPERAIPATGKAKVYTLPAVTVVYAVYRGSYDDFGAVGQLHGQMAAWITANGYQMSGASREYYLRPPQGANDRHGVMELQYPVTKV